MNNKFSKLALIMGGFFGMTAVMAGAMGAHALQSVLDAEQMASFQTAVRYQMFHALLLLILGMWGGNKLPKLDAVVMLVIAGVFLFSGSIYILTLADIKAVWWMTPTGGVFLIIAWGFLIASALKMKK